MDDGTLMLLLYGVPLAVIAWGIFARVSRYRRCPHCGARALTPWACPACGDDPYEEGARR